MANSEVKSAVAELRDTVENQMEPLKDRIGDVPADVDEKLDRINERLNEYETKMQRRDIGQKDPDMSQARKAFSKWLQRENLSQEDTEALEKGAATYQGMDTKDITVGTSGNQSDALAPEEFVQEIIKDAVEISPVRQVARTRSTDRRQVKIPKLQGRPSASYVSEQGTRSRDTTTDFGADSGDMLVINMHEFGITVPISRQMERDSVFDIEAEVREVVSTEMARFEGNKFLQGSGSGAAQGLVTSSGFTTLKTADTTSDDITSIAPDEVIDLKFELKDTYRNNGTYALTREAINHVRTLRAKPDGTSSTGEYLWEPGGLAPEDPPTIQGRPYVEMQDLVTTSSAAQGDVPIVFGDWNRGYLVVDRIGMQVLRDPYSNKETGTIDYQFYAAHGGDQYVDEALKGLEIA